MRHGTKVFLRSFYVFDHVKDAIIYPRDEIGRFGG
jgi:hypothetical protein